MLENIKVLIKCMTFNHKPYIVDAMNGFVMQETNFPYTAVIIDDASTDGQQQVILDYLNAEFNMPEATTEEAEDFVRIIAHHKSNASCTFVVISLKQNHYSIRKDKLPYYKELQDTAEYIALCEGDGYWVDPYKIQRQVDILEADESFIGVATNRRVVNYQGNTIEERSPHLIKGLSSCRISLRDFFKYNITYPTASVMYRNSHRKEVHLKTEHMRNPFLGDWTLWIALHCFGDFYYLDEVTMAYRINPTSVTHTIWVSNRVDRVKCDFELLPHVADVLPSDYNDIAADLRNTNWVHGALAKAYFKDKSYINMIGELLVVSVKCPSFYCTILERLYKKLKLKLHIK